MGVAGVVVINHLRGHAGPATPRVAEEAVFETGPIEVSRRPTIGDSDPPSPPEPAPVPVVTEAAEISPVDAGESTAQPDPGARQRKRLERKQRRKERPKLFILCDGSSSVANVSRFMMQFMYSLQESFTKIRVFPILLLYS